MTFPRKLLCVFCGLSVGLASCAHTGRSQKQNLQDDQQKVKDELGPEVSLKEDRDYLKEARKDIPLDKQKTNDELALYLQLMGQGTEPPQNVRDKFNSLVQKRRQKFRDKVQKLRDDYHHDETARRNSFLSDQSTKRQKFAADKHAPGESPGFFARQDGERKSFFDDERDRRANFEAEINSQSKDFDSYMRERINEFNERYRLYAKKLSEQPKAKKAVTGESDGGGTPDVSDGPSTPQPLGTGD